MRDFHWLIAVSALAALACGRSADAGSFNISPIRAYVTGAHRIAVLTLTNADDVPVVVQVRVVAWSQENGEERLEETRDLLLAPPVLQIPANAAQIVRIALRRDPDPDRELSYRVLFEEVPQAAPNNATGLRVALRLSVPVFVAPARGKTRPDVVWESQWRRDGKLQLDAINHGTGHLQVTDFDLLLPGADDSTRGINAQYVLPGSRMRWTLAPGPGVSREGPMVIRGHSDQGDFSADVAAGGL